MILAITGLVLYIVPAGRIAYWVEWSLLGLGKEQWGQIHVLSCLLFLIAGGFHIYFNWKPLLRYFVDKARGGINLKRELTIASLATLLIVVAAIGSMPPFHYVFEFGDFIKSAWVVSEEYEPPFGHAELTSLKTFSKKQKIDVQKAVQLLRENNVAIESEQDSLAKIAKSNEMSPMQIYRMIKPLEKPETGKEADEFTVETVESLLEGKGIGRRNVEYLVREFKLDIEDVKRRLNSNDIEFEKDEDFHDIADRYGTSPIEIVKIILVKGYRL